MEAGLKKAGDKVKSTTMCLIRTIRDLDRHHDDTQYGRYCDLIDGIEDDESQERILSIRELEVFLYSHKAHVKLCIFFTLR